MLPETQPPHGTEEKLVRMANQIATFFASQPEEIRAEGVATHINKFWERRMRRSLFSLVEAGGAGLDPLVLEAAPLIRRPEERADAQGALPRGTGHEPADAGAKGTAAGQSLSEPSIPERR